MVTRGVKATPYQDPRVTISPATIVIIPEYKSAEARNRRQGSQAPHRQCAARLSRRAGPEAQFPFQAQLHHRLRPGRQCRRRRSADARSHGFVATCNSTHFFIVRRGEVWTSTGQYCIPGITRGNVIRPVARTMAFRSSRKHSRSMTSMAPMRLSSPAPSPVSRRCARSTAAPSRHPLRREPNGRAPADDARSCTASSTRSCASAKRSGAVDRCTNIAMWSGPRNISTAMMYAFGNRADCFAWDEPFYAFSLDHHGNDHPMRDEIIAANDSDWRQAGRRAAWRRRPRASRVFYQKHMTHHMLTGYDRSWITRLTNAFLIRSPERVLASYAKKWAECRLARHRLRRAGRDFRSWSRISWARRRRSSMPRMCSPIRGRC